MFKKRTQAQCTSARAPLVEGLSSPRRQPDPKTLAASLGKQGRLDYVNFGTYVPAFKPLPKVRDYTLLFTRNGRAPYILGCVAEIVTANGWKTFIPVRNVTLTRLPERPELQKTSSPNGAVDGMLTLRASKVVVFVRKRSLMCKGNHWRRWRNARF